MKNKDIGIIVAGGLALAGGVAFFLTKPKGTGADQIPPTPYACPYDDGYEFATLAELTAHITSMHPDEVIDPPPFLYDCPFLDGYSFATLAELTAHVQEMHQEPTPIYPCPYDGQEFATQAALDAHLESVHGEEPPPPAFVCEIDGQEFDTNWEYRVHMHQVHGWDEVWVCPFDHELSYSFYNFVSHMSFTHGGGNPANDWDNRNTAFWDAYVNPYA